MRFGRFVRQGLPLGVEGGCRFTQEGLEIGRCRCRCRGVRRDHYQHAVRESVQGGNERGPSGPAHSANREGCAGHRESRDQLADRGTPF